MVFICVFMQFSRCFGMGVGNFHIKESAAKSLTPESVCLNATAEVLAQSHCHGKPRS